MNNIKIYIIGALLLLGGILIGWVVKPANHQIESSKMEDHATQDAAEGPMGEHSHEEQQIWTCSMHPQIRQNEPGLCPICEMDLIPLDNSMSNDDPAILKMSKEAVKLAQIQTTIVGQSAAQITKDQKIEVEGTIELDERNINAQSSHIGGRIEELNVNFEGEYVQKGQKIATIYSTALLAASQELLTAAKFENKVSGIKEASIQKLKNWKITDEQINRILNSGKPIETIELYADHSGYVLKKMASLGDYITQGKTLYTVSQTNRLWLLFNVFESDLGAIRKGALIEFRTPSTGEQKHTARVSYIEPLLDPVTRTATVRAEVSSKGNQLKPGMLITGIIKSSPSPRVSANQPIVVPGSAVLWTGQRSVVYVKEPDSDVPSFQFREVEIGSQSGNSVTILSGLENGEEVVTNGAFAIDAAAQLNNNMSMMNRSVTVKKDELFDRTPDYKDETPDEFKRQLDGVAEEYLNLKDALIETDPTVAAEAAEDIGEQLAKVDMSLLTEEAHAFWMEQLKAIESHHMNIKKSDDVEVQRKQFAFLSEAVIAAVEAFGTIGNTFYVQYCPMALNNQGANWLSKEEQVLNPYYGDKMLKCGSIKRVLN